MKTQVEIISATECKSCNPLGQRHSYEYYFQQEIRESQERLFYQWQQAENDRKVYLIKNNKQLLSDPPQPYYQIGSIHEAEVNEESLTAIIC